MTCKGAGEQREIDILYLRVESIFVAGSPRDEGEDVKLPSPERSSILSVVEDGEIVTHVFPDLVGLVLVPEQAGGEIAMWEERIGGVSVERCFDRTRRVRTTMLGDADFTVASSHSH